ncbi:collagen-like protein [Streptomyces sp. NBC_01220]|uniref:hypothetical protein n=1 Tax=Streptomyces sp. NBC_01220 TaxID=2903781 RepID=UPI00352E8065|nr:collagen-like protein [Streptomyces sp. NBC_01220]
MAAGLFAAQGAAIVIQQGQINDLKAKSAQPGPRGEAGAQGIQGPQGPRGIAGAAGKDGEDGQDGAPAAVSNGRATQMTSLEARAHCTELANKAYPDSTSSDPSLNDMTEAFNTTMREKSYNQCMSDEGYPQP